MPRDARVLWIAAAGGHIAEAVEIDRVVGSRADSLWVTFDTPQTRSLLDGRRVEFTDYVAPRDLVATVRAAAHVRRLMARESFDACISTGSAVAGLAVPMAALAGMPAYYVESLARFSGPSLTGRIMRAAPKVSTLTQAPRWSSRQWAYEGSLLDSLKAGSVPVPSTPRRVLVTLGTIRPYRFDRAVDAVLRALRPDDEVVWQLGATGGRTGLPGAVFGDMSYSELSEHTARADVVVSHAGVGSVFMAHQFGKLPVLATRSARHGEHVDEHQSELSDALTQRGLALQLRLDPHAANSGLLDQAAVSSVVSQLDERTHIG